ncbi:hypothetical protein D3C71_2055620 [compost metagenome]
MLIFQHRLRHQPVQLGPATDEAMDQAALMGGAGLDLGQGRVLCRSDGGKLAISAIQIGRQ